MYLTLPLPVQKQWRHEVYYIPWELEKPHVKVSMFCYYKLMAPAQVIYMFYQIPVEIGKDASMKDLRHLLGRWMDANPDNVCYHSLVMFW